MESQPSSHTGQPLDVAWAGKGSDYIGLGIKIFFLKIITLGIYHFWGKTEVRKKLWNHVRLNSEPLEYTGTGMELFLGFLFVVFLVFLPLTLALIGLQFMFGEASWQAMTGFFLFYMAIFYLVGVAIYSALKYRMSRTQWRGIRGAVVGSRWKFGWVTFWTTLVTIITLGLAGPWQSIKLNRIMTNDMRFGETPMHFTGTWQPLFKFYIPAWLAAIGGYAVLIILLYPTFQQLVSLEQSGAPVDPMTILQIQLRIIGYFLVFGLIISIFYAWYQSKYYNYIARETKFSNGEFALTTTPGGLIWITLSNFFIVIFSLTILSPVAIARWFGYLTSNLSFNGNIDIAAIEQSQERLSKTGEGLAEGFDIDAI